VPNKHNSFPFNFTAVIRALTREVEGTISDLVAIMLIKLTYQCNNNNKGANNATNNHPQQPNKNNENPPIRMLEEARNSSNESKSAKKL
jgi:hypothetical protein